MYIKLLVCMLSWPFGAWPPVSVLFPAEDHLSYSQLSLIACSSLHKVEFLWTFPSPTWQFIGVILVPNISGQSYWWDVMSVFSDISRKHNLIANFSLLWLLHSFHPLFSNVSWVLEMGVFLNVSRGIVQFSCDQK